MQAFSRSLMLRILDINKTLFTAKKIVKDLIDVKQFKTSR